MSRAKFATRERQIVAALFIVQAKVDARGAPLTAMCGDAAASGAMMCEQVREFVPQRPVDFGVAKFAQPGV